MTAGKNLDADRALNLLTAAVEEAGEISLAFARQGAEVFMKDDASPVTEADLAIDAHLKRRLLEAAPGIGWLSEETADDPRRLTCAQIWVVDPIDGTRGFIKGTGEWAISAALVENGQPLASVLLRPTTGEFYRAVRNGGAFRNGLAIRCSAGGLRESRSVAGPKSYVELLRQHVATIEERPRLASLALRIAETAQGALDIAFAKPRSHEWDTAAAGLILQEAGGRLAAFDGTPLLYNRPDPHHPSLVAAGLTRQAEFSELLGRDLPLN